MKPLSTIKKMIRPTAPIPTEATAMKQKDTKPKRVRWADQLIQVREYHKTPKMVWNQDSSELLYENGPAWIETTKGNMFYVDPSNPQEKIQEFFSMDDKVPFILMKRAKTLVGGAKRVKRKLNLGPPLRILVEN
tara:strand:+ start:106 stop:507 length:402 start_codon:yes stop_codon:yes gene_type:complete